MNGALLLNKPQGVSSFGVIELLQRELCARKGLKRRDLPKLGHGGTLDPFATGLLVICVGNGVKLARYFLGSDKVYEGVIRFGETTIPGDPTAEISERSETLPSSLEEVREYAAKFTAQPYLQTPPMHSAKKVGGKVLYELARRGLEIEREAKACEIRFFEIRDFERALESGRAVARSRFNVGCSSGTYIRVLAQDLGRMMGSVAMLDRLHRTVSGIFSVDQACTMDQLTEAGAAGREWDTLPCWVPFDRMMDGYDRAWATDEEANDLRMGRQKSLFNILKRIEPAQVRKSAAAGEEETPRVAIYESSRKSLLAVACREQGVWGLERVFCD